jgi:hypothetical protein
LSDISTDRLSLMDGIVGQCIRDLDFGARVLDDPVTTLAGFGLEPDEMDDFIALARQPGVLESWRRWHEVFVMGGRRQPAGRPDVDSPTRG